MNFKNKFVYFSARNSSRNLVALSGSQRGAIIHKLANLLEERVELILEANQIDLAKASASGKIDNLLFNCVHLKLTLKNKLFWFTGFNKITAFLKYQQLPGFYNLKLNWLWESSFFIIFKKRMYFLEFVSFGHLAVVYQMVVNLDQQ